MRIGENYNRLTAIGFVRKGSRDSKDIWLFRCECGGTVEAEVSRVRNGYCSQCRPCGRKLAGRVKTKNSTFSTEHPLYATWANMMRRCYNENNEAYMNYGGRGIIVCVAWHTFKTFLRDMGEKPESHLTLERINNNGNYEPDNCCWATRTEQRLNQNR